MLTRSEAEGMLRRANSGGLEGRQAAWDLLYNVDGPTSPDLCVGAVEALVRQGGAQPIVDKWATLSERVRRNVAYGSSSLEALNVAAVEALSRSPETSPELRHLLIAGLVRNAAELPKLDVVRISRLVQVLSQDRDERRQRIVAKFKDHLRELLTRAEKPAERKANVAKSGSGSDVAAVF